MKRTFKELTFGEIKAISEELNHEKAILTKIEFEHEPDEFEQEFDAIGIKAIGTIYIPFEVYTGKGKEVNWKIDEITSGGLWGIDANSDQSYFEEIEKEQAEELAGYLRILNVENRITAQ